MNLVFSIMSLKKKRGYFLKILHFQLKPLVGVTITALRAHHTAGVVGCLRLLSTALLGLASVQSAVVVADGANNSSIGEAKTTGTAALLCLLVEAYNMYLVRVSICLHIICIAHFVACCY